MSRHLVDPELAVGLDTNMPTYKLDAETLPTYRQMLLDMVAAIPKPTSEAMINVRRDERLVPGPESSPDVRVLVYTPADEGDVILPAMLHIHGGGFVSGTKVGRGDRVHRRRVARRLAFWLSGHEEKSARVGSRAVALL